MRYFWLSSASERFALLLALFFTVILLVMLMFISSGQRKAARSQLINSAMLLAAFILHVCVCREQRNIAFQLTAQWHLMIPMPALWAVTLILCTHAVFVIAARIRRRRNGIERDSIREAVNTLPVAICYFNSNGTVKLCNLQMYRLYRAMTQSDLQTLNELHEALEANGSSAKVIQISESEPVWRFPNGTAWMFSETSITAEDGKTYVEAIFTDVTELYNRKLEIQKQTEQMREVNWNIRQLSANVAAMTKEEEMLSLKTRLHDRLGTGIAAARQAILQHHSSEKMDTIIRMWHDSVDLVARDNENFADKSDLHELMRDADVLGISIITDGSFPENHKIAEIFLDAVQECLTNCVKHAKGTEIYIKFISCEKEHTIIISNNGKAPEHEIIPGGGLTNLHNNVMQYGGKMEIQSFPEFRLTITMTERRDTN